VLCEGVISVDFGVPESGLSIGDGRTGPASASSKAMVSIAPSDDLAISVILNRQVTESE
jgi:hypothetical protein